MTRDNIEIMKWRAMVSRKDVAREAGVSAASVSYYINKNGYVSEAAGKKIQAAIEKLHYTPNQVARSLKIKDSKQFVFLCNEIRNPFFAQLVYRASKEAYKKGYSILFSNVIDDESYLKTICSYQVSGLFVSNSRVSREAIESILQFGVPIVMLKDTSWDSFSSKISVVQIEQSGVFREIVSHLRANGCRHLHYISGSASAEAADKKTIAFLEASGAEQGRDVSYGITTSEQAAAYMEEHWADIGRPDGVVCTNDAVAEGVIFALNELGVRIPEDVAVVGYDNTFQSRFYIPSISSVDFGGDALGEKIIDMLIQKVQGMSVEDETIRPVFIPRASSMRKQK